MINTYYFVENKWIVVKIARNVIKRIDVKFDIKLKLFNFLINILSEDLKQIKNSNTNQIWEQFNWDFFLIQIKLNN